MKKLLFVTSITTCAMSVSAFAQFNNLVNGGTADWATASWNNGVGVPPTAGETAFFNGDNTTTIQSGTNAVANVLRLGDNNSTFSSLSIASGGTLTTGGLVSVANAPEANFFLNIAGDYTGTSLFIGGTNNTTGAAPGIPDADGEARVTINGGSVNLSSFIQFSLGTTGNINRLVVNGSTATLIQASQIQVDTNDESDAPIDLLENGELQFNFDAAGITPISLTGFLFGANRFDVIIDGSSYTGGAGTFTLIDCDSDDNDNGAISGEFNSIDVNNFAGLDAVVDIVDGDLVLTLTERTGTVNGALRLEPNLGSNELILRFGFEESTNLTSFADIDLSSATIELDPADTSNQTIKVTIPGVTEDTLFIRLSGF